MPDPPLDSYLRHIYEAGVSFIGFSSPCFYQQNVAAGQTDVTLNLLGTTDNSEIVMPTTGNVVGISIASNAARSAGTLTVVPTIDGTASSSITVDLDATNTQYNSFVQQPTLNDFDVNQRLGVEVTTTAGWAPVTADIVVNLFIIF